MDNLLPEEALLIGFMVAHFLLNTHRWVNAIDLFSECLVLLNHLTIHKSETIHEKMEQVIRLILKNGGSFLFKRGAECSNLGELKESTKYFEKALFIHKQIGSRSGEAVSHCHLGRSLFIVCQYDKAIEHFQKALDIREITGRERQEIEARAYNNLGELHYARGNREEACRYFEKALGISEEIKNEIEQAVSYTNLGIINHNCLGKLDEALAYHMKSLEISKRLRRREGEGLSYNNIGGVYEARGEYDKALEYYKHSLAVSKEIKDRRLEGINLYFIGKVYHILGQYKKALEHQERALEMKSVIREKKAGVVAELGILHKELGDYEKAMVHLKEAIKLCEEIGDIYGKGTCYNNLGIIHFSLGEYEKAKEYLEKCIGFRQTFGDKIGLAMKYCNIGEMYNALGDYQKSREYLEKALQMNKEIGDRRGETASILLLGSLYHAIGKQDKAIEYAKKALEIAKETGERQREISSYTLLGIVQFAQGHNEKAIEYLKRALEMMKEIGIRDQAQFAVLSNLGLAHASEGDLTKACDLLLEGIKNHQSTRASLKEETHKLSLDGKDFSCYETLSWLLVCQGKFNDALFTLELGRGRALVDLISQKYGIQGTPDTSEVTSSTLQSFFQKQKRNFLFIAMLQNIVALWFVDKRGNIKFKVGLEIEQEKKSYVAEDFGVDASISVLDDQEVQCEDRSLSALYEDGPSAAMEQNKRSKKHGVRQGGGNQSSLEDKSYKVFIAPIADLIDSPELIIAPEGSFFLTPFASFKDEKGKYLFETVKIRLIPSLTTLKIIQDAPAEYHCQTGALIVGDPKVGPVEFKGKVVELPPLPKAREEAHMVSRLLGVSCLVGEQATKEEVLHRIHEVSLVHIAAHGYAERGEIALAPNSSVVGVPKKDDFMLTIRDIADIGIRAKLVVLSCCHSASGKILTAEGVVGIARAFLGSGARSVLMSLWAVDDEATKAFMNIFYKGLICEKLSGSEALHQAMKKMKESPLYNDRKHWAPFVLLGDDVTLNF